MDPRLLRHDLERLRDRLRRRWLIFGAARLLAFVAAALPVLYLLDRLLVLPRGVRLVLLLLLVAAAVALVWRGLIYPWRKKVAAEDLALAVEARHPELDGRLISTLELTDDALAPERNVSRELVLELRKDTEVRLRGVRFQAIFDDRRLRRAAVVAAVLLAADVGFRVAEPELCTIFVKRLFGGATRWPQRTSLAVTFPETADHFRVAVEDGRPVRVQIARGASLPVTVFATGEEPEVVELRARAASGRLQPTALSRTAPGEWVGRFRNVGESFSFRPAGGDDDGAGREVEVVVEIPPTVAAVATRLEFPAYTGLEPREEPRGDVEAPVGSRAEVRVDVREPLASGTLVFDAGLGTLDLAPQPAAEGAAGGSPGGVSWRASFVVSESCTYAIHLVGANGFRNLEPSSYAVVAVKDRAPTLRVLEPVAADVDVTPNGLVAFRVAADDDYGVAGLDIRVEPFGGPAADDAGLSIDLLGGDPAADPRRRLEYRLLDLAKQNFQHLDGRRPSQAGDSFVYVVSARDGFTDATGALAPNETRVAERRADVVTPNEKLRLLTERQIRRKDDVRQLRDLQAEKLQRVTDALAEYEGTEGDVRPAAEDLAALEVGQNLVGNRAVRLSREFGDLFEEYLLNRLDPSAAAERLVPLLEERKRASTAVDGFDFAVYRPLVSAYQSGGFGRLDVAGRLLDMLACILDVAEVLAPRAAASLGDARLLVDPAGRPALLRETQAAQREALERLDLLLEKMDEWEDFQEILTLFRDLIEDQRELNDRTRRSLRSGPAGEGGGG